MAQSKFIDYNNDIGGAEYLRTSRADPRQITFTPQQLAALEELFPEQAVGSDAMTDAKVRHHLGQRSVIAFVRDRVAR